MKYYKDFWQQRNGILAPLMDFVGNKKLIKWEEVHQELFDTMKNIQIKDVLLVYHNFNVLFEINTDDSDRQLGAYML